MHPSCRILFVPFLFAAIHSAFSDVEVKQQPDRVRIEINGSLFTEYRFTGASHVYYWPLIGPGGLRVTRSWPMEDVPGEERDHPHHRSMWFAHGSVNGVDFWGEAASYKGTPKFPVGAIEHDRILEVKSGTAGVLVSSQKWSAPDGSVPLRSVQTLRVYERPQSERLFDFEIVLTAGEKDVVFGDTKEGTFAIRIAESMRLKAAKGAPAGAGMIVNSEGVKGEDVWGKNARWVDMSGPVDGRMLGITIMEDPANFRHPTRWHARSYGLFAANPFCEHDMDKSKQDGTGSHSLLAGQSLTLKYRVLIHEGDAESAKVDERYAEYLKSKK